MGIDRAVKGSAVLFVVLLFTAPGCLSYEEVAFKGITNVELGRMDPGGVAARVTVTLDNPNNFRIHVLDPNVDLFLNDVYIGKAVLDSNLVLDKKSSKDYPVPLHATFDDHGTQAMGAMLAAALTGKATLKAKGSIIGRAFLLRKRFPFEEEHEFEWDH
ncbi:MAG: LEA type 2 family protein [Flavobacteriales bacterium]|nr:LEA type 2 family protein [Flavobacteriales bacterium]